MLTLGIDTAGNRCAAALWQGDRQAGTCLGAVDEPMERGHAEALFPLLERLFENAGQTMVAVDRIAVVSGPGTFTGVRVGLAAARGLALALDRPAVSVSVFELLLGPARESAGTDVPLVIAFDARRGEIYVQAFDADGMAVSDPMVLAPATALAQLDAAVIQVAGSGAQALADAAAAAGRPLTVLPEPVRDPCRLARLGADKPTDGPPLPLYIRPPDAKRPSAASLRVAT